MKKLLFVFLVATIYQVLLPQEIKAEKIFYENKPIKVIGSKQKNAAVIMIADLANGEGLFLTIEESAKIIEKMKKEGYTLKSTEMHNLGTIAFVLFLEK